MSISIEGALPNHPEAVSSESILRKLLSRFARSPRNQNEELRELQSGYLGILLATLVGRKHIELPEAETIMDQLARRGIASKPMCDSFYFLTYAGSTVPYSDPRFQTEALEHFWPEFPRPPQVE